MSYYSVQGYGYFGIWAGNLTQHGGFVMGTAGRLKLKCMRNWGCMV